MGYKLQQLRLADLRKKNVYLKDIENSKTGRKSWKSDLEISQNQGRLGNSSLSHIRIRLIYFLTTTAVTG